MTFNCLGYLFLHDLAQYYWITLSFYIGVGRFWILWGGGGQGLEYWGRGANSQQAHDVVTTSTSFRRHVPTRFSINQCQIITFLILKSDIVENSRLELRGIVLPAPSNQIKVTFIIILPFNLIHLWFFPVSHRNWRKRRVDYWGVGAKGMLAPSQIIASPTSSYVPTPMFYINTSQGAHGVETIPYQRRAFQCCC